MRIAKIIGMTFTVGGFLWFISGTSYTNGLLAMILGEVIDLPKQN